MDRYRRENRARWRPGYDPDHDYARRRDFDEDRGFFDKAGDEVRSWFGDDEAERRREMDERRWRRERAMRSEDQDWERHPDWHPTYGSSDYEENHGPRRQPVWTGSGFGGRSGWEGTRFDRVDAGSTGTHGAHPISSTFYGGYASRSRRFRRARYDHDRGDVYDRNYAEWRNRQLAEFDRDYEEFRRENQTRFDNEFRQWRKRRSEQRETLNEVEKDMEVVGSDEEHIGRVDYIRGERIILARNDENSGGIHHSIPCSWIDRIDDGKIFIDKTADEAMNAWREEERSRALFEREDQGSEGPHMLNRSFSGTYS
ncbi:MAG: DUF2171 domain-containing protein [Sphingomonadaceae bacterium]